MESCGNYIRVRVDLRDVGLSFVKQAWVSVDRTVQRTVKDFKLSLYPKFKLAGDRNISLYLQGCLLPDEEPIFLLRDNDVIRVVYENLPSLLDSQCNDFMGFARARSPIRRITDGRCDVSLPSAKKARVLSPVLITESFHDMSDTQNSVSHGTYLGDISTEINTVLCKTESPRKKHKKRKKRLVEKNQNSCIEDSLHFENGLNNSATDAQEIGVLPEDKHGSLIKGTQDHHDKNCGYEVTSPKEHKVKERKHCGKTVLSEQLNESSSTSEHNAGCADAKKSRHADVLSANIVTQSNGHKNSSIPEKKLSKEHKAGDEEILNKDGVPLEKGAYVISVGPENCMDAEKLEGKISNVSNVEFQCKAEVINNVTGSCVSPKTECGSSDVQNTSSCEVSQSLFPPSLHSKGNGTFVGSLQVKSMQVVGDCTQSLGNNCPKRKRTRRSKRKSKRFSEPCDKMTSDCSSSLLPSAICGIDESVADFIRGVRNENNGRKHIRFTDCPESNHAATVLDNGHSVTCIDKPVSALEDASHSSQKSLKTGVSLLCEDGKNVSGISFHQEEPVPCTVQSDCADGTKNTTNVQETCESTLKENQSKLYGDFPPLSRFPLVGDIIAFKMLELTDSYCPEVSEYKEGRVVNINSSTDVLEIDLMKEQRILRTGKFENVYPDETLEPEVIKKVFVQWSALIEPKLLS